MRPSVEQQLRTRAVEQADVMVFVNRELIPWARQTRQFTNQSFRGRFTIPTAHTATFTTIWTSPDLGVGFSWFARSEIMADAGAARSAWVIEGLFFNAGTVAQEGATFAAYTQSAAAFAVRFQVVANHVEVQVQDDGVYNVKWAAAVELSENQA